MEEEKYIIQSAMRTLKALDLFTTQNAHIGVSELQKELGITSNMAFRILLTLEKTKYIIQNPETGKFRLSLRVIGMGNAAAAALPITKLADPYLQLLFNGFNRRVNVIMFVYEQEQLIVVEKISSNLLPKVYAHVGRTMPINVCAAGKVLISELADEELEALVQNTGLERFTNNSITTLEELKRELKSVRKSQLAWEKSEHMNGLNGVASPIRDVNGKIYAAVCINAFENNVTVSELESMIPSLEQTTRKISEALGIIRY